MNDEQKKKELVEAGRRKFAKLKNKKKAEDKSESVQSNSNTPPTSSTNILDNVPIPTIVPPSILAPSILTPTNTDNNDIKEDKKSITKQTVSTSSNTNGHGVTPATNIQKTTSQSSILESFVAPTIVSPTVVAPSIVRDEPPVQPASLSINTTSSIRTSPSIPVRETPPPPTPVLREMIQLQPTVTEAMKKVKILEETNKVLHNEKKSLQSRIQELEADVLRVKHEKSESQNEVKTLHILLESEKQNVMNVQRDLNKLKQDLIERDVHLQDLKLLSSKLQLSNDEITTERDQLKSKFEAEKKKTELLESKRISSEKKLTDRESEIQKMTITRMKEHEERMKYIEQLQTENHSLIEEREKLIEKDKNSDDIFRQKTDKMRHELAEITAKHENQIKTIERLLVQKRNLMFQLGNEVKRNGILIKENSELKHSLQVQQQLILQHVSPDSAAVAALLAQQEAQFQLHNNANGSSPSSGLVIGVGPSSPSQHDMNTPMYAPVPHGNIPSGLVDMRKKIDNNGDTVVMNTGGTSWLASIPIVGRFWGKQKTFKKTFEVIV
eukprot:TRINITY_DN6273_c0_g1_i1.p1 TRINITY_DN6273_c0_g1~~TRINITY_DN6273_c0_g1_i1.p1  ORF type:complete len:567 (-),score=173.56 TRINITY_DN6273_c0_g1_i1:41-1702(-)